MNMLDLAGTWWVAAIVLGTVALGIGLAYGSWQSKNAPRDAGTLRRKDAATRENFKAGAVEERTLAGKPVKSAQQDK